MTNTHIIRTDRAYGAVNDWPEMRGDEVKLLTAILRGVPRMDGAACVGEDPDLWFADKSDSRSRAKAQQICSGCPAKAGCESYAVKSGQRHGTWGDVRHESPEPIPDTLPAPARPTCWQGHKWTETNTGWQARNATGEPVRYCRTCHADRQRARRQKAAS